VHATPDGNPALENQDLRGRKRMSVDQYRGIIDQIKGRSSAVSLYYLGDPLVHPDLDEMCRIAADANLSVHINTNFSFRLSDERLRSILTSGLTHFTACIDGITQEVYELTRVNGRIDLVMHNLRRLCEIRRELGQSKPYIEVQFIKFQHNRHQLEEVQQLCDSMGVNRLFSFWGELNNYTDVNPGTYTVYGPRKKGRLPLCVWPYISAVIKWNGDVIPCCGYRDGQQYSSVDDPMVLGNVFDTDFSEVWNSEKYKKIRRLVSDPTRVDREAELKNTHCYGCSFPFETNRNANRRIAKYFRLEDLYRVGRDGVPIPIGERGTPVRDVVVLTRPPEIDPAGMRGSRRKGEGA
jgi:MoaA/NifB/PqqE/SkfB family radical SAM enzyme